MFAGLMDRDDVGVLERRRESRLGLEASDGIGVLRVLGRDDLQRDGPVELLVGRPVDHAHPATLQQALDAVTREERARLESGQAAIGLFHDATPERAPWTN